MCTAADGCSLVAPDSVAQLVRVTRTARTVSGGGSIGRPSFRGLVRKIGGACSLMSRHASSCVGAGPARPQPEQKHMIQ